MHEPVKVTAIDSDPTESTRYRFYSSKLMFNEIISEQPELPEDSPFTMHTHSSAVWQQKHFSNWARIFFCLLLLQAQSRCCLVRLQRAPGSDSWECTKQRVWTWWVQVSYSFRVCYVIQDCPAANKNITSSGKLGSKRRNIVGIKSAVTWIKRCIYFSYIHVLIQD